MKTAIIIVLVVCVIVLAFCTGHASSRRDRAVRELAVFYDRLEGAVGVGTNQPFLEIYDMKKEIEDYRSYVWRLGEKYGFEPVDLHDTRPWIPIDLDDEEQLLKYSIMVVEELR